MTSGSGSQAIWQVSGGPAGRSYADHLIRHGVVLVGSGDAGPWHSGRSDQEFDDATVRWFATELRTNDVLLLRTGLTTIRAIGVVVSEYQYLPQFDDVNGLDLQHGRRVRWRELPASHDFGERVFGAPPLRLSRVSDPTVTEYARRFMCSPPTGWQEGALPPLPEETEELDTPPPELREIVALASDLSKVYQNESAFGAPPLEDEMVAHYVVPFLRALGWCPEKISVKWQNVDLCVFNRLPRCAEHCRYLIEVKRPGVGPEGALEQATGYASALGIPCDVVVTDGIRYRMYDGGRNYAHAAYANLARLKRPALELFARMRRP